MRTKTVSVHMLVGGLLLGVVALSCARSHSDDARSCEDADEDGWGSGPACAGPDCDDADPKRHTGCDPNDCPPNACDTCERECDELVLGGNGEPWACDDCADRRLAEVDDALTVAESYARPAYVWLPIGATIAKVNVRSLEEEGRYRTSAIGVDVSDRGDLFARGGAHVVRFNATDCRDGRTSSGPDEVLDEGEDACEMWRTYLPSKGSYPPIAWEDRGVLDGRDEYVWTPAESNQLVELTGEGEVTGRNVETSASSLRFDLDGDLWTVGSDGFVEVATSDAAITRTIPQVLDSYLPCVTVDSQNRVWAAGGNPAVLDQSTEDVATIGTVRSVTVAAGAEFAWLGGGDGRVHRVSLDALEAETFQVGLDRWEADQQGSYSPLLHVSVDTDGQIWGLLHHGVGLGMVTASLFPPDDPASFETAYDGTIALETCEDLTGTQPSRYPLQPGAYTHVFPGCTGGSTTWHSLRWEGDLPAESYAQFEVRAAATPEGLAATPWIDLGSAPATASPLDVGGALSAAGTSGDFLELRITLRPGFQGEAPTLDEVGVGRSCPAED